MSMASPVPAEMHPIDEDLLSSVLGSYQMRTHVFANPSLCGNWRFGAGDGDDAGSASFHMLAAGHCWLHLRDTRPLALSRGDLLILPRPVWHLLAASRETADSVMRLPGGDGDFTTLICGHFEFLAGATNPILDTLPTAMIIPADAMGSRGQRIAEIITEELAEMAPGRSAMLDKLGDALFVMSLRHHINQASDRRDQRGLLAALADRRLAHALGAIHRNAHRDWTVAELAATAAMSRAAFAEHFHRVVGVPPIDYLTRWRMTRAELMLVDPQLSMEAVAERLGYESVESFRRAFKRIHGRTPGAFKRFVRERLRRRHVATPS